MLALRDRKVWLYREAIDFRKQMNGLVQLIVEAKSGRPNDGAVYVFRNRQRDKVKLLLWHHNGFSLGTNGWNVEDSIFRLMRMSLRWMPRRCEN